MVIKKITIFTSIAIAVVLIATAIFAPRITAALYQPLDKEGVIDSYIHFLSAAEGTAKSKSVQWANVFVPGMGTESNVLPTMSLDEAEKQGLLSNIKNGKTLNRAAEKTLNLLAVQQHDLVVAQFGADSWENVSYTLAETDPIEGTLGYRLIATGELISEEEYNKVMHEYWNEVARKEHVDYYDIFLRDDEIDLEGKRVDLIAKYGDNIPAELTLVSDNKVFKVSLSFNSAQESAEGYEDFHFIICEKDGSWAVFEGLAWSAPNPNAPTGD